MKPLFVFKGKCLSYHQVVRDGNMTTESVADVLPQQVFLSCRQKNGGVNSEIIYNWAVQFVDHVRTITVGSLQVLLFYDGYCSHMSLKVLNFLHHNNVIVYTLLEHTSGKTQLLDVVLFAPFKKHLRDSMTFVASRGGMDYFDMFDFCGMLLHAYGKAFSRQDIVTSFRKTGIWPMNPTQLLCVPLLAGYNNLEEVMDVNKQCDLMEEK